jgi:nucleoid-associated protein YgaU
MGRDKVLGLSLAILLIGFGAAFCFRNEPFVENGIKLARAKLLDEGIAQRPGPKPYITEGKSEAAPAPKPAVTLGTIEAIESREPQRTSDQSTSERFNHDGSSVTLSEPISTEETSSPTAKPNSSAAAIEEFVSAKKDRSAEQPERSALGKGSDATASSTLTNEKPLELTIRPASPAFDTPDSLLEDAATWRHPADCRDGCPAMTSRDPNPPESSRIIDAPAKASSTTYSVRRGDTLTKIAQHFLGDSNRYREIFEANRDRLESPNARLRVGMNLRIPEQRQRSRRTPNSTTNQSRATRSNDPGSVRPRQVPARPVSRTRELATPQPKASSPAAASSLDESQDSNDKPRFIPATKGPFWRSRGESSVADPQSRDRSKGHDLSQRAPSRLGEDDADHRKVDRESDDNRSDYAGAAGSSKSQDNSSTMDSDGT